MMTIEMIIDSYDNVCDQNADDHGGLPGWMIKTIFYCGEDFDNEEKI